MLTSIAYLFLLGLLLGSIFQKLKLPGLLGMMLTGMILGPFVLNVLDPTLLSISADLRQVALVIILTRAGLSLDIVDLKRVGRPAVLMCFVPATFEIIGTLMLAPKLLGVSLLEAAIIGSVIAAVSPAVVVPRMIRLMEDGFGKNNSVPQLIMAGASVDDVYVIVLFTAFTGLAAGTEVSIQSFVEIPISIVLGIALGVIVGYLLVLYFKKFHMRDSIKLLVVLSVSFLVLQLEDVLEPYIAVSGLLAIMSMGIWMNRSYQILAKRLSIKYNKLWVAAEVMLFVLVGALVNLEYLVQAGLVTVCVLLGAMLFRMLGVFLSVLGTKLDKKERTFCMLAYTPKATVQAAIGSVPLAMGLACGEQVLIIAVLAIMITAPFGAICVDMLHTKLLSK